MVAEVGFGYPLKKLGVPMPCQQAWSLSQNLALARQLRLSVRGPAGAEDDCRVRMRISRLLGPFVEEFDQHGLGSQAQACRLGRQTGYASFLHEAVRKKTDVDRGGSLGRSRQRPIKAPRAVVERPRAEQGALQ